VRVGSRQSPYRGPVLPRRRQDGLAARVAAWSISAWPSGETFVVSLAPTGRQVKRLLWRELNRVHAAGRKHGPTPSPFPLVAAAFVAK
jgi:hypothetical protein